MEKQKESVHLKFSAKQSRSHLPKENEKGNILRGVEI